MAHLLASLKDYFELEETNIDNWAFKLFYKVSCGLCMVGATIGVASQYFGDPISCDFSGIDDAYAKDYCWVHGSNYIPQEYQEHMKCKVNLDEWDPPFKFYYEHASNQTAEEIHKENRKNAPVTSYYQWVTFVMAIQAGIFYLPHKIWSLAEGGLLESFGTEGKKKILLRKKKGYEGDDVVMEDVVEKFVEYFKSILHHNNWYFAYFVGCELLNFFFLWLQLHLTDGFLNHKFAWYGWNVMKFYMNSDADRKSDGMSYYNPMCAAFPTEVSCMVPNIGAAGGEQYHNGLCILTQNIINEKIYLVLWFWYAFLVPVSFTFFFYRGFTILVYELRFNLLYKTICHKWDKDIRKCLHYVLAKCQLGDWFVLYQLCKNCNPYFFREFIKELARELKRKPKETKKTSKDSSSGNGAAALGLNRPRTLKGSFSPATTTTTSTTTTNSSSSSTGQQRPPNDSSCCSGFSDLASKLFFLDCSSDPNSRSARTNQNQNFRLSNNKPSSFEDKATSEDESEEEEEEKDEEQKRASAGEDESEEEKDVQKRGSQLSRRSNNQSVSIKIP